jgi:predicted secreted protein
MEGAKGRALGSLAGGFGGLTSETAGQAAELFGASPPIAESARIVGGLLPLEAVTSGTRGVGSLISMVKPGAGTAYNVMRSVMQDVGVANLAGKQRELVMQRIEELRQSPFTTDAQRKIYDSISDSVSKATNLAEAEANLARSTAGAQASGVRSTAQQVSKEEREKGVRLAATRGELEETKKTLLDRAKSGLREVGDATVELSQMGATLRDRILQRFETGSLERSEAYKQQKALRDQAVANKEGKGIFVDSTPEYQELVKDLTSKLLIGRQPLTKKTAEVTEPGVQSAYRKIYDAITNKRVMIEGSADDVVNYVAELKAAGINVRQGTNPKTGEPAFYREYKTSFDAMDDVRRKLGDAAFGKEAEGARVLRQN